MNLLKRAAFLKNLSGNATAYTESDLNKIAEALSQIEAVPHFSDAIWTLTGTISARSTNSTTGYTDIGSYTLEMGTTYGNVDQTQPVFHPSQPNQVRMYRATAGGYMEMKLGFIWSGNPGNYITNFGTGGFIRYINRTRGTALTQIFLTETVGTAPGTVRYTKSGNLTQTGEAVGDAVRLEYYLVGA